MTTLDGPVDVGGVTLACTDTGPPPGRPDAPAVVFGHGLLFGGWMFRHQVAALRPRYRCVTLDWRGQGGSPPTRDGYDMDTLTGDALGVLRRLDTGPVHWVGVSMGGFVGQRLAARHPGALRSLTLLGTSADAEEPSAAREYRTLALVQLVTGVGALRGRVEPLLFGPAFRSGPAGAAVVGEWARRCAATGRRGLRRAVLGVAGRAAVAGEIGRIAVPTLVVVGADDRATPPARSERIAALVPGTRCHVLPDCGHSSPLEQPERVTALLADHLDAAGGRA